MEREPLNAASLIETVREQAASGDPLALLETAVTAAASAGDAADAMVDHYVATARHAGQSWTAIGEVLGVSKQAARQRFSHRLGDPTDTVEGVAFGMTPRVEFCVQAAQEAADADDSVPGTQHLLIGLLQVGVASNVLAKLGVTRERVVDANARLFEPVTRGSGRRVVGDGEAELAITRAKRFAADYCPSLVRTEHLLFVLATDPGSSARRVLDDLGVDVATIKKDLEGCLGRTQRRGRRHRRDTPARRCTFCGCPDADRPMVAGPGVWICSECVALATDILKTGDRGFRSINR
jgi:ATP-dependent Clp protease ATP-binding subunit ClpA